MHCFSTPIQSRRQGGSPRTSSYIQHVRRQLAARVFIVSSPRAGRKPNDVTSGHATALTSQLSVTQVIESYPLLVDPGLLSP